MLNILAALHGHKHFGLFKEAVVLKVSVVALKSLPYQYSNL